jgi:tetratricopeptide (TPR) repeat protein
MKISCACVLCVLFALLQVHAQNNAATLRQSGLKAYRDGHYAQAEALLRSALQEAQSDTASAAELHADMCSLFLDEEKVHDAKVTCRNAADLYRRLNDNQGVALALRHIGATYLLEGRDDQAISTLKQALKTARKDRDASPFLTAAILNSLGMAYFRTDRLRKAEKMFEEALMTADSRERPEILSNLGATEYRQKKFAHAEELLKEAVRLTEIQLGNSHPKLMYTLASMGKLYTDTGRFAEAQALYQRSLEILERNDGDFAVRTAVTLRALSEAYLKDGKAEQAEATLRRASDIARQHLSDPTMPGILEAHAQLLISSGKREEAQNLQAEARRARIANESTVRAYSPR